jgi:hypothetical protein
MVQQENQGMMETSNTTREIYTLLGQIAENIKTGGIGAQFGETGLDGKTQGMSINTQPPALNVPVNLSFTADSGASEETANKIAGLVRSELMSLKPQIEAMAKGAVGITTPPMQYAK